MSGLLHWERFLFFRNPCFKYLECDCHGRHGFLLTGGYASAAENKGYCSTVSSMLMVKQTAFLCECHCPQSALSVEHRYILQLQQVTLAKDLEHPQICQQYHCRSIWSCPYRPSTGTAC